MGYKKIIDHIQKMQTVDRMMVDSLYRLSLGSLSILLVLTTGVALYLYPVLSDTILIWASLIILVILFRLYCAYKYIQNPNRYTPKQWYVKFVFLAMTSAFLFSSLSFGCMPGMDDYYQLFIITVIIGLTSGSITSLSSDFRLAIAYITVLLLPLILTLVFEEGPFNNVLILALILYYIAQISMIIKNYNHELAFKEIQSKQIFLHNLFQEAPIGIFSYDTEMKILDCNPRLAALFEHTREDIIGMDIKALPDTRPLNTLSKCLTQGSQTYAGPYVSLKGKEFWIEVMAFPFSNERDSVIGGVGIIEDKTKEHNALSELEYLVEHDVLTGLLNRRGFTNYMNSLITDPKHSRAYSLLFYLDLNQFKSINDSLGHTIGDDVLLAVSKRLRNVLPEDCTVSRLGGDEFIVIVPFVAEVLAASEEKSKQYSKLLEETFTNPFAIEDMLLHIKASIGIVIIEPAYRNIEEIIRHADITMYQAKNSNDYISYYNESLDRKQKELFALQHDLAHAVQNNQLRLFLQPIVTMSDETVRSAELLLRWQHPKKGLLSPDAFISLAVKAGLLSQITWWLIDELCRYIETWKEEGMWNLEYISININAQQLIEKNFATTFLARLQAHHIETKDLMIEITERSLIDNFESTQAVINHLRSEGVRCAIDDFGIGYSSLSYLKKLSFHTLKIDKEFVKNIEAHAKERTLMKTILDIGREFDYHIVIEGLENQRQKEILEKLDPGLSYQGYLFDRALPVEDFSDKYLKK
jgi:diguanylate cyclase (GGDEF)-like protein/PAS domain S-box-containing protein